jgi:hypothetical protein
MENVVVRTTDLFMEKGNKLVLESCANVKVNQILICLSFATSLNNSLMHIFVDVGVGTERRKQ